MGVRSPQAMSRAGFGRGLHPPPLLQVDYGNEPPQQLPHPNYQSRQPGVFWCNVGGTSVPGHIVAAMPVVTDEKIIKPLTIGDAIEKAAIKAKDQPLQIKDLRALQCAESRALGIPTGILGGPTSYAQSLADRSGGIPGGGVTGVPTEVEEGTPGAFIQELAERRGTKTGTRGVPGAVVTEEAQKNVPTLGDALQDAKKFLPSDKVASPRDAEKVQSVERRNDPLGRLTPGGIGECMLEAAEFNVEHGFVWDDRFNPPAAGRGRGGI